MYISKKLLTQINPIFKQLDDQAFEHLCNRVGIEVEAALHHHPMKNLQIAYLEEVVKHPNAEKLNLAQVRLSKDKIVPVVCGAANIKAGVYAIYAPIGTAFLDGRVIESKNIRGVDSCGMLCGYNELTVIGKDMLSAEDSDGIVLLDKATLGDTNIHDYIDNDDTIYDLSIPSNRSDLNAAVLLAHELLVGLQEHSDLPTSIPTIPKTMEALKIDHSLSTDFGLLYLPKAPRFKPNWKQKQLLMSSGYKVHDSLLDLMNLFTIKYGNPIHLYNADHLKPAAINVKALAQEQTVVGLDAQTYKIPKASIGVFADDELINVAGIIGLECSKYVADCQSVIIEVANFNPTKINQTANAAKIQTKAQAFFSKQYSNWITQMTYAALVEHLTNEKTSFECYYDFSKIATKEIKIDLQTAKSFIGTEQIDVAKRYGFSPNSYIPHPTRIDINNEFDVYEEIMKFVDINQLTPQPINFTLNHFASNQVYYGINKLRQSLINYGLMEVKTYNLTSLNNETKFNFFKLNNSFKLTNPISKNREVLRKSMIDELLKTLQYNLARKRELFNIFEIQSIVHSQTESCNHLTMLFATPIISNRVSHAEVELNLLNIKSFVAHLFYGLNQHVSFKPCTDLDVLEVYPQQSFEIQLASNTIGYLSLIKQSVLKQYDISQPVFVVTLKIDPTWFAVQENMLKPISGFPVVYRDVNLTTNNLDLVNQVLTKIKTVNLIKDCWVSDVYSKQETVYTLTLKISDPERTLTEEAIKQVLTEVNQIITTLSA